MAVTVGLQPPLFFVKEMPRTSSLRFATLTPENAAARKCLELVVDKKLQQNAELYTSPIRAVQDSPKIGLKEAVLATFTL